MKLTKQIREEFVQDVMKNVPRKSNYDWSAVKEEVQSIAKASLPEEVRKCLKNFPQFFTMESAYVRPYSNYVSVYLGQKLADLDISVPLTKYEVYLKEREERRTLATRIQQIADSVTTTNRLREVLPELASLVPEEYVANKMLPTTTSGVVADLMKLGFQVSK